MLSLLPGELVTSENVKVLSPVELALDALSDMLSRVG